LKRRLARRGHDVPAPFPARRGESGRGDPLGCAGESGGPGHVAPRHSQGAPSSTLGSVVYRLRRRELRPTAVAMSEKCRFLGHLILSRGSPGLGWGDDECDRLRPTTGRR
jgi:hypothetical protein